MKAVLSAIFLFVLAVFIVGCSDKGDGVHSGKNAAAAEGKKKPKSFFPVEYLAPTSVIMRINGAPITKADYAGWFRLRDRIFRATYRMSQKEKNDRTRSFARDNRDRMLGELMRRELMRQEAERLGVEVPETEIRKLEKRFMSAIRHAGEPFENVTKIFDAADVAMLKKTIYMDARDGLCLDKAVTNDLKQVSEKDIDDAIAFAKKWNEDADKKMAVQRERALKVRDEILNGGIFATITSNRADLAKDEGGLWQTWTLEEAMEECEPLAKWLLTAQIGDISEPFDFEDGLAIVGLKGIEDDVEQEPGKPPAREYELVRCTFFAYDRLEEYDSRKELAREILKERRRLAMRDLGERLIGAAKIEFPLGERIFYRQQANAAAGKKAKKKQKGAKPKPVSGVKTVSGTNSVISAKKDAGAVDARK